MRFVLEVTILGVGSKEYQIKSPLFENRILAQVHLFFLGPFKVYPAHRFHCFHILKCSTLIFIANRQCFDDACILPCCCGGGGFVINALVEVLVVGIIINIILISDILRC